MDAMRYIRAGLRRAHYLVQKATRTGVDRAFAADLRRQAEAYLAGDRSQRRPLPERSLEGMELSDAERFAVAREDIYVRFAPEAGGPDVDEFGRAGRWVPRGCVVYRDRREDTYVKVFEAYFSTRGEGRFLPDALERGLYDFLCPGLAYVLRDEAGLLRGYAIREGEPVSPYAFEWYVEGSLREVVCAETERTGLFFNDLTFHNVVRHGDRLSLIDLESVMPVAWFETDLAFARAHLDEIDIGWPYASKWESPAWYGAFVRELKERAQR